MHDIDTKWYRDASVDPYSWSDDFKNQYFPPFDAFSKPRMIMIDNSKFELIRQNYSNLDKQNVWRNPGSLLLLLFNTFKSTFKHFIFATIYKANRIVIVCSEVVFIVSTNHERLIAFCEYLEWQIIVCVQTFNTNDDNGKGIDPAIGC